MFMTPTCILTQHSTKTLGPERAVSILASRYQQQAAFYMSAATGILLFLLLPSWHAACSPCCICSASGFARACQLQHHLTTAHAAICTRFLQ
jgi:hypothetical protein